MKVAADKDNWCEQSKGERDFKYAQGCHFGPGGLGIFPHRPSHLLSYIM